MAAKGFLSMDEDLTDLTYSLSYLNVDDSNLICRRDNVFDMCDDDDQFDSISHIQYDNENDSATATSKDADVVPDIPFSNSTISYCLTGKKIEDQIPRFLRRVMQPHQIEGASRIYEMLKEHKGAILGDVMGLGTDHLILILYLF